MHRSENSTPTKDFYIRHGISNGLQTEINKFSEEKKQLLLDRHGLHNLHLINWFKLKI